MNETKDWTDVLLYFVPALLVLITCFLIIKRFLDTQLITLRKFMERDYQIKNLEAKSARTKDSLPLKLQSYERMVLFLERISANSILLRVHRSGMSAGQLQSDLVTTIRAEFEHNLSQQIYISDTAWEEIKNAKEEMIRIINRAYETVGTHATGIQMSSQIFEQVLSTDSLPTQGAIDSLKREARKLLE
jgi:hypothetical protein